MSPITSAPSEVALNANHEPRLGLALSCTSPMLTSRSPRGIPKR